MSPDDAPELEAELEQITGLTLAQLIDLEKLPEQERAPIVADWAALGKLSWVKVPSAWDRTVAILNLLATVATPLTVITGGITGFAGAIAAIKAI